LTLSNIYVILRKQMSTESSRNELLTELGFKDLEPEPLPVSKLADHSLAWSDVNQHFNRPRDYSGLGEHVITDDAERAAVPRFSEPTPQVVNMIHQMYSDYKHAIEQGYPISVEGFADYIPQNASHSDRALMNRHIMYLTTHDKTPEDLLERLERRKRGEPIAKLALTGRVRSFEKPVSHAGQRDVEALLKEIKALRDLGKASQAEIIEYLEQEARHLDDDQAQALGEYVQELYADSDEHELSLS